METIEYHTIDKSTWGDGPWQNEPDKVQFVDPETGLSCLIRRHPELGNLCGYVGLSNAHPYSGKSYDDLDVAVHGGLTYASFLMIEDGPEKIWAFGFDCAHAHDFAPGVQAILNKLPGDHSWMREDIYRDIPYVKSQIASLAKQLKALETQ